MRKFENTLAAKKGVAVSALRLLLDGERVKPHETAYQLEIEDGDVFWIGYEQAGD